MMNNRRGKGRDEVLALVGSSATTLTSSSSSSSPSSSSPSLDSSLPTTTHQRIHKAQRRPPMHRSFWWGVVAVCAVTMMTMTMTSLGAGWFIGGSPTTTNNNNNKQHITTLSPPPPPLSFPRRLNRTTTTSTTTTNRNKTAVEIAFDNGFWQRMQPVPRHRWNVVSNTTCVVVAVVVVEEDTDKNNDNNNNSNKQQQLEEQDDAKWHSRVPYVILMGTQKGGSTALAYYLYNHPHIVYLPTKELHFFDEELDQNPNLIVNEKKNASDNNENDASGGIPQAQALEYYQQHVIGTIVPLVKLQLEQSLKVLDATPNYMFCSDRVIRRILCICPWVQLLVLLRDPITRAYSQYHMQLTRDLQHPQQRRGFTTFDDYVRNDIQALLETGVLLPNTVINVGSTTTTRSTTSSTTTELSFDQHFGSDAEFEAWSTYTKLGLNSPVGRGLCAIQLNHLVQALRDHFGPTVTLSNHVLVQSSEIFRNSSHREYHHVLEFLKLPRHDLSSYTEIHKTSYGRAAGGKNNNKNNSNGIGNGMSAETRNLLQHIFEPYNRKLVELLRQIQGDHKEHDIGPAAAAAAAAADTTATTTTTTTSWETIWSTKI